MTHDYVSVQRQGRVAIVTFDRGNPLNALSLQAIEELTDVARNLERDLEVSAIVLTTPPGSGFSAGRDLVDPAAGRFGRSGCSDDRYEAATGMAVTVSWEVEWLRHMSRRSEGSLVGELKAGLSSQLDDQPGCPPRSPGRRPP